MQHPWTLGTTRRGKPVYLSEAERSTHLHIVGASGRGKSKLLEDLIRQDIIERRGLCLIDPDGYLYEWLTAWCAQHELNQTRKIILLDPHMPDSVFGFNPLRADGELSTHAEAMQAACAQVWGGESMQDKAALNMGLRAVFFCLAAHKLTLVESLELLDPHDVRNVRRRLTEALPDLAYRAVWGRYNNLNRQQFEEQLGSTYRRLFEFLDAPLVRAIVGQQGTGIDFRKCMDEGAIVLVNLQRKGALTEGKARLLGTLIVNDLFQRALTRPQRSRPFTLYIDECTDYLNTDITRSIDRARKFGLRLVLAHQRLGQLEDEDKRNILSAVMSVQSKVVFGGLEVPDAERLAHEVFNGEFDLNSAKRKFATPMTVDHVPEWLLSESEMHGTSLTATESQVRAEGGSTSRSHTDTGDSISRSSSQSSGEGTARPWFGILPTRLSRTESSGSQIIAIGGSQSDSVAESSFFSSQSATSRAESTSYARTTGRSQTLRPVLKLGPGIPMSLDELVYRALTRLKQLPKQHAILKPTGRRSVQFEVSSIKPAVAQGERVAAFARAVVKKTGLSRAYATVTQEIEQRLTALGVPALPAAMDEPEDFHEPIPERPFARALPQATAPRKPRARARRSSAK